MVRSSSSAGVGAKSWWPSSVRLLTATLIVAALCFLSSFSAGLRLLASTVLALGGNGNPTAQLMEDELNGYIKPGDPNYGLCATAGGCATDRFIPGTWNATVWTLGSDFDHQQADGVQSLDTQLRAALAAEEQEAEEPGGDQEVHVYVVGYSSSADVVTREMTALQQQWADDPENAIDPSKVSFLVMGNPNRPNGGILARFGDFTVPVLGVSVGGSNPDTDYPLTDISWKYDLASDAPAYLNPLSFVNAVFGFFYQHSFYYGADPNGPGVIYDEIDPNTGYRYITIEAKHLAMLQPLYDLGVPVRLLDAIEPTLEVLIDLGYDRETPPWEPTRLKLAPSPEQIAAALPDLQAAISEGVQIALGQKEPPSESDPDTENATLAVLKNVLGSVFKDLPWDTLLPTTANPLRPNLSASGAQVFASPARGTGLPGPADEPASLIGDLSLTPKPKPPTAVLQRPVVKRPVVADSPVRQALSGISDAVGEAAQETGEVNGKPRRAVGDRFATAVDKISDQLKARASRDLRGPESLKLRKARQLNKESADAPAS